MKSSIPILVLLFLPGIGASLSAQEVFYYPDEEGHMELSSSGIFQYRDWLVVAETLSADDGRSPQTSARILALNDNAEIQWQLDYDDDQSHGQYISILGISQGALWYVRQVHQCGPYVDCDVYLHYILDSLDQMGSYLLPSSSADFCEHEISFDPVTGITVSTENSFELYTISGSHELGWENVSTEIGEIVQTGRDRWLDIDEDKGRWITWDPSSMRFDTSIADFVILPTLDYQYNHLSGYGGFVDIGDSYILVDKLLIPYDTLHVADLPCEFQSTTLHGLGCEDDLSWLHLFNQDYVLTRSIDISAAGDVHNFSHHGYVSYQLGHGNRSGDSDYFISRFEGDTIALQAQQDLSLDTVYLLDVWVENLSEGPPFDYVRMDSVVFHVSNIGAESITDFDFSFIAQNSFDSGCPLDRSHHLHFDEIIASGETHTFSFAYDSIVSWPYSEPEICFFISDIHPRLDYTLDNNRFCIPIDFLSSTTRPTVLTLDSRPIPNPANTSFVISASEIFDTGVIVITDISGRQLLSDKFHFQKNYQIPHASSGIYFYQLRSADHQYFSTGKIILSP